MPLRQTSIGLFTPVVVFNHYDKINQLVGALLSGVFGEGGVLLVWTLLDFENSCLMFC